MPNDRLKLLNSFATQQADRPFLGFGSLRGFQKERKKERLSQLRRARELQTDNATTRIGS